MRADFPGLIRDKREKLGLKQEEFAKYLAVKESVIHKIESGSYVPSNRRGWIYSAGLMTLVCLLPHKAGIPVQTGWFQAPRVLQTVVGRDCGWRPPGTATPPRDGWRFIGPSNSGALAHRSSSISN